MDHLNIPNPELQLADEFLKYTRCNIFLTGKAGTGKTTFLKNFKKDNPKRIVVTAPTGVAAINAGGVTLHSFFQMPFGPFVPGSEAHSQSSQRRFNREKINIIKSLDLLVIDEISMVRADLLDGVDAVLRRYRRSNLPFGDVQLLMIGDLHQLSPVVKDMEWRILKQYYDSPYFFSSNALRRTEQFSIELKHIYRQSDSQFIDLLNGVRDNNLDISGFEKLNKRCNPEFSPDDKEGYITLCTHNRKADGINISKLHTVNSKKHTFDAVVEGDFPEHTFPTPASLDLKIEAQVMFVRNDQSPEKRYFNGKIGKITRITSSQIWVKCPEEHEQIVVEPAIWENVEYTLNQESGEINENKIGSFEQYPLKLAWAITIHKSQGLTFDRAIIDAQAAFAHGQVYVALSRCRTLEGLVLSSSLSPRAMKTDPAVLRFTETSQQNPPSPERLETAKIEYQQLLLLECFDFQRFRYLLGRLVHVVSSNPGLVQVTGVTDLAGLQKDIMVEIHTIGENFKRQLQGMFKNFILPTEDPEITERIVKGATYFQDKMESFFLQPIQKLQIDTDNKEIRKKAGDALKLVKEEGSVKMAAVKSCLNGFSPTEYLRSISSAEIESRKKKPKNSAVTYSESDIDHPELFQTLREWRTRKSKEENIAPFQVMHQKTLIQIIVNLPDSLTALDQIKGIGKKLSGRYGDELISMVSSYRKKHGIEEVVLPAAKEPVPDQDKEKQSVAKNTKEITLELFEKGLTIPEIAKERSLVNSTIESHLAFFVSEGQVKIETLLPRDKIERIEQAILRKKSSFSEVKNELGADCSYGEIRLVQSHINYMKKQ